MENEVTLSDRIEHLETRIAFQDKTLDELSAVLAQQQEAIEQLKEKMRELATQLGNAVSDGQSERPPHY